MRNSKVILLFFIAILPFLSSHAQKNVYSFKAVDATGNAISLRNYKGKVLLIVNTATQCGFTPQYEELEKLYEELNLKGFEVLDFPCNQFGSQAPGSYAEIHQFCTGTYNIRFQQFDKVDVNGENAAPLFVYLRNRQPFGGFDNSQMGQLMHRMLLKQDANYAKKNDVKWNFTKFLIDRRGRVVRRFEPTESMESVRDAIRSLL